MIKINEIELIFDNIEDIRINFNEETKILIISKTNNAGKSTLIKSIMFAFGANEDKVFYGLIEKPKIVRIKLSNNSEEMIIERESKKPALLNNKLKLDSNLLKIIEPIKVRYLAKSELLIRDSKLWEIMSFFWIRQERKTIQDEFNGIFNNNPATFKDLVRSLKGININDYIELEIEKINIKNYNEKVKAKDIVKTILKDENSGKGAEKLLKDIDKQTEKLENEVLILKKELRSIKNKMNLFNKSVIIMEEIKNKFKSITKEINGIVINAWDLLKDHYDINNPYSIKDRIAFENIIKGLQKEIQEKCKLIDEINSNEYLKLSLNTKKYFARFFYNEMINESFNEPKKLDPNIENKINEIKKQINQKIKEFDREIDKILQEFNLNKAIDGASADVQNLIKVLKFQKNINLPILHDCFWESTDKEVNIKTLKYIDENLSGQIIATALEEKIDFDLFNGWKIIHLNSKNSSK